MTHTLRILLLMWAALLCPLDALGTDSSADHVDRFRTELDALVDEAQSTGARPHRGRIEGLHRNYFADNQFRGGLENHTLDELVALHTATEAAFFYTLSPMLLDRLGPLVTQLTERLRRDDASRSNDERGYLEGFHAHLLRARRFSQAQEFAESHELDTPPWNVIDETPPGAEPTVLEIDPDKAAVTLIRIPVHLGSSPKVVAVVHPHCGPSGRAMNHIEDDPTLTSVFAGQTVWLTAAYGAVPLQPILDWNVQARQIKIAISYDDYAWPPEIDFSTPVFYFFRDGVIVDMVIGWPGPEQAERLHAAFDTIGVASADTPMPR